MRTLIISAILVLALIHVGPALGEDANHIIPGCRAVTDEQSFKDLAEARECLGIIEGEKPHPESPAALAQSRIAPISESQIAASCHRHHAEIFKSTAGSEPVGPGIGRTRATGSSTLECVRMIGTRSADHIRASGHVRRVNRPDT